MNKQQNVFIGLAWPYANGSLHLGHISAFIGADILARYFRRNGNRVLFVSGSDCYGTPIAVEATELGIHPSVIAEKYDKEFRQTLLTGLNFSLDIYTRTTTEQHAQVVQQVFLDLYKKGYLYKKVEPALYSPFLKRFLPDRFVEGTCPKCGDTGARGDQCDNCGELLSPLDLKDPRINPRILKRDTAPSPEDLRLEVRESEHFFLKLSSLQETLEQWVETASSSWRSNARSFAKSFLKQGLHDRAITRDTNWGVPIPLPGYEEKCIYVWFEAVCGYLSASKLWAEESGQVDTWKDFWQDDTSIHYYVHGKDNIPFHTIIWPAILLAEGSLHTPNQIVSSEYLTLEGKQFSKSRSWAVWLPDYLREFEAEALRYFLVVNGPESGDANFVWSNYAQSVNSELIGTLGNLVNRILTFGQKHFPDGLRVRTPLSDDSQRLLELAEAAFPKVGKLIEEGKFRNAFKEILTVAEHGNRFVHTNEPWNKIKDPNLRDQVETDLAVIVQIIRALAVLIDPFLPQSSEKILGFLGESTDFQWAYPVPVEVLTISNVNLLFKHIDDEVVTEQVAQLGKPRTRA